MENKFLENIIHIPAGKDVLEGSLIIPDNAKGIVLFAHGSGSSRHSPRNNYVAQILQQGELGTLLIDLLTVEEDANYMTRFDIELLTNRLVIATNWLHDNDNTKKYPIAYFGASTGAAAALKAAAKFGENIKAVVSRGGRPDLADEDLDKVKSPTLLIVGGDDDVVIDLNKKAFNKIITNKELIIIPGATHLFEEPGTLEEVARIAKEWFLKYLAKE